MTTHKNSRPGFAGDPGLVGLRNALLGIAAILGTMGAVVHACVDDVVSAVARDIRTRAPERRPLRFMSSADSPWLSAWDENRGPATDPRFAILAGPFDHHLLTRPPATLHVPAQFATIPAAIAAAQNGDTILVQPGTYAGGIDFSGKMITLVSAAGSAQTILSGGPSVVLFHSGETAAAILDGFTIRDGIGPAPGTGHAPDPWGGAGIQCVGSSPTIRNCVITANAARFAGVPGINRQHGGGALVYDGSPHFTACRFEGNRASNGFDGLPNPSNPGGCGGAVAVVGTNSNPVFSECVFIGNSAGFSFGIYGEEPGEGGAIYGFDVGGILIQNSTFTSNVAGHGNDAFESGVDGRGGNGGAIYVRQASQVIVRFSTFTANAAGSAFGGGVDNLGGDGGNGGAIFVGPATNMIVEDCTFESNHAGGSGSATTGLYHGRGGSGGAICAVGETAAATSLVMKTSLVSNNYGGHGRPGGVGGISVRLLAGTATIDRCRVLANSGGRGTPGPGATPSVFPGGNGGVGGCEIGGLVTFVGGLVAGNTAGAGGDAYGNFGIPGPAGNGGHGGIETIGQGGGERILSATVTHNHGGSGGIGYDEFGLPGVIGATGHDGVIAAGAGPATIVNSILWANEANGLFVLGPVAPIVGHSCIRGGFSGVGNTSLTPRFVDDSIGDFRPKIDSPTVDAGQSGVVGTPLFDLGGHQRTFGATIDIGAHESLPPDWTYLGSGDDFTLTSKVNGEAPPSYPAKAVAAGQTARIELRSPSGTLTGSVAFIALQSISTIVRPGRLPGFPIVHVDPSYGPLAFIIGTPWPSEAAPLVVSSVPIGIDLPVVPGLTGMTVRFQAFLFAPIAANGIFAASDAHDLTIY